MSKLISICSIVGLLLVLPTKAICADSPVCWLGQSIVEQLNSELAANSKVDPIILAGSMAFVQECPSSVVPAFRRFADNERQLRGAWIEAVDYSARVPANRVLRGFLIGAKTTVDHNGSASLKNFLDGIFEVSGLPQEGNRQTAERNFEQQSLAGLKQFPHCDGANCYDASDFLLFLLGTHPDAFLAAMHAEKPAATKWLSELGDLSFAGDPSESQRRDSIRRYLLERVSELKVSEFTPEKSQCVNALRRIRFRAWK